MPRARGNADFEPSTAHVGWFQVASWGETPWLLVEPKKKEKESLETLQMRANSPPRLLLDAGMKTQGPLFGSRLIWVRPS